MQLDLRKGVFHTHPIYQLLKIITSDWEKLLPSNSVNIDYNHRLIDRENFKLVSSLITKLWVSKFIELDVCGRPLFANPVTNFNVIPRSRYSDRAVTLKKAAIVKISIVNPQISQ